MSKIAFLIPLKFIDFRLQKRETPIFVRVTHNCTGYTSKFYEVLLLSRLSEALMRPKLEYASRVWSPWQNYTTDAIKEV